MSLKHAKPLNSFFDEKYPMDTEFSMLKHIVQSIVFDQFRFKGHALRYHFIYVDQYQLAIFLPLFLFYFPL